MAKEATQETTAVVARRFVIWGEELSKKDGMRPLRSSFNVRGVWLRERWGTNIQ